MKQKKFTTNKKLMASASMLLVSMMTLSSATYAWFTMNKDVSVVGMELKAHAEEGLLINEVKAYNSTTWDEQATANTTPQTFALRPASTSDLATWWHANSKKSSDEAGTDALADTVDVDASGNKYTNISPANVTNETIVGAEGAASGAKATGNTQAETHVYYKDASFGTDSQYDDGEGYYVNYKYYLKSSGSSDLSVTSGNLGVTVTAALKDTTATATELDKALRVGVKIGNDILIFAPTGGDASYKVTGDAAGTAADQKPVTAYNAKTGINTAALSIPSISSNADGLLVDVYVWFEGEDQQCMSDNLTATLNAYEIRIDFTDDDI